MGSTPTIPTGDHGPLTGLVSELVDLPGSEPGVRRDVLVRIQPGPQISGHALGSALGSKLGGCEVRSLGALPRRDGVVDLHGGVRNHRSRFDSWSRHQI